MVSRKQKLYGLLTFEYTKKSMEYKVVPFTGSLDQKKETIHVVANQLEQLIETIPIRVVIMLDWKAFRPMYNQIRGVLE